MKRVAFSNTEICRKDRHGSTLVIVIALLGLLAFMGMVFFTFASQDRASSEYFSDAAKTAVPDDENLFDWGLRHVLIGPSAQERNSILYSPSQRHSAVKGVFGSDIYPHTGAGVTVILDGSGVPIVPGAGPDVENPLNMVDSPKAWGLQPVQNTANNELSRLFRLRGRESILPEPDVDYTSPDINTMFVAYRGWAIRDNAEFDQNGNNTFDLSEDRNGNGTGFDLNITPRYEAVPITIPSYFRPQYMKTAGSTRGGHFVPTDPNWVTTDPLNTTFAARSFRPHPAHKTRNFDSGAILPRYLDAAAAAALSPPLASGGFSFVPPSSTHPAQDPAVNGELGIFTGSHPSVIELDVDNDGFVEADGNKTNEGIWLDLDFPVQELIDTSGTTRTYVVLHSFTIYDLDSLINTNIHGNLTGLGRDGTMTALVAGGAFGNQMLSKSNLGLGPNEINPTYALRRDVRTDAQMLLATPPTFQSTIPTAVADQFIAHFGRLPANAIEQANMELVWLLMGQGKFDASNVLDDMYPGRWGDVRSLYTALNSKNVADYPRPGRGDNQTVVASAGSGARFGGNTATAGRGGYDDNQDRFEGEASTALGKYRPFGHPTDFAGGGRHTTNTLSGFTGLRGTTAAGGGGNALTPDLINLDPLNPASWLRYTGYSLTREVAPATASIDPFRAYSRYIFGTNQIYDAATEGLMQTPFFDPLMEDPLEQIFDPSFALRPQDNAFGPQDTFALHMDGGDISSSHETPSRRITELAPFAAEASNRNREMLTTYSSAYRYVPFLHPHGSDGRPGRRGIDDDGDGLVDEADEIFSAADLTDVPARWWEFSSDADGADRLDASGNPGTDGFPDGDGNSEFPPKFGSTEALGRPYGKNDPFRPQVRRILTVEAGENRGIIGQLPLSINHMLDVDRTPLTPIEGTKEFLYFMQRSGLKFRGLTEHPSAHVDADNAAALDLASTDLPVYDPATNPADKLPAYPPQTVAQREFWARRDRQQMARDIYVLLYTLGGARKHDPAHIADYRRTNDPNLAEGAAFVGAVDPNDASYADELAYLSTPQPLYTHRQLRRMAQFAVNLVDAMDTDNIVTKFEYDKNLGPADPGGTSGGWELDDNPFTDADNVDATSSAAITENGLYPEDSDGRGVVFGVEAQQLALSEVLAIRSKEITTGTQNNAATQYTDDENRDFLYVELQNMLPMPVDLATDRSIDTQPDKAVWRLVRNKRDSGTSVMNNSGDPSIVIANHADNLVDGGGRFSLSVASDATLTSSAFFVDLGDASTNVFDGVYELVAPDVPGVLDSAAAAATEPLTDLDLLHMDHIGRFAVVNGPFLDAAPAALPTGAYGGNATFDELRPGSFAANPAQAGFDLVLQRRMNPDLPSLLPSDNPWIEVDRMKVEFKDFELTENGPPSEVFDNITTPSTPTGQVVAIKSRERIEPLSGSTEVFNSDAKAATPHRLNTIKGIETALNNDLLGVNSRKITNRTLHVSITNPAIAFNIWQPHFDRDYASSADLLGLPVFSPYTLTQHIENARLAPYQQIAGDPTRAIDLRSAASLFLMPDFPDVGGNDPLNEARDNRWYRMLQFVEVPSRVHRMLGNYLTLNRMPGKINLNMIRHREVYAGLIDSPFLMDVPDTIDATPHFTGTPPDLGNSFEDGPFTFPAGGGSPDRWQEFITERDGITRSHDPGVPSRSPAGAAQFLIPGMPNAVPFRSLASRDEFQNPLQSTVFRTLREDLLDGGSPDPLTNRNWLEIGTVGAHQTPNRSTTTMEKYQLLGKLQNNTTTVSNCFIVFATAGYFEAKEHTTAPNIGLVQVGGPLDVDGDGATADDRKRAVFIIDRTEALNAFDAPSGSFDWSQLVRARLNIQE